MSISITRLRNLEKSLLIQAKKIAPGGDEFDESEWYDGFKAATAALIAAAQEDIYERARANYYRKIYERARANYYRKIKENE